MFGEMMDLFIRKYYDLLMFNRNKKSKLDILFQSEINRERNQLNKAFKIKRNTQKEIAANDGTLHEVAFESIFVKTELEHAKESSQSLYNIYKRNYCSKGVNSKNTKALFLKLDKFQENNFDGFCLGLDDEASINPDNKVRLATWYERELKSIVGDLKSILNIEVLKGNRVELENEADKIVQSHPTLSLFKWLGLQCRLHKIVAFIICIVLILFLYWFFTKFPKEACQILKGLIQPKK
jgi:hypothetical protein